MYFPISRLACVIFAIAASQCIFAIRTQHGDPNVFPDLIDGLAVSSRNAEDQYIAKDPVSPDGVSNEFTHAHIASDQFALEQYVPEHFALEQYVPCSAAAFVPQPTANSRFHPRPESLEVAPIFGSAPQLELEGFDSLSNPERVCGELEGASDHPSGSSGQHVAPEVVLRFGSGCTDAEFTNWKLSSLDKPCAKPAIPHGPLVVEILINKPIDFVELIFDGKPLTPSAYSNSGPLSYSLPCPAPGQHWLQARYLSGNIWSHHSKPIRFEVRLPAEPRIIAASDFDRDPTPLGRSSITSITTHSIKVYLADVKRGDNVVAYIDGKPLPAQFDSHSDDDTTPLASDSHLCCRVFRVAGVVTPGVHKLTVRVAGCSGACSITSEPSKVISFHYYDEDIYVLKPGAGCSNGRANKACSPTLKPAVGAMQSVQGISTPMSPGFGFIKREQDSVVRLESAHTPSDPYSSTSVGRFRLVSIFPAANTDEAHKLYQATKKLLDESSVNVDSDIERIRLAPKEAKAENDAARTYLGQAQSHLNVVASEKKRVQELANAANEASAQAHAFASAEAACGHHARARVAQQRSNTATQNSQLAHEQLSLAEHILSQANASVVAAESALKKAASDAASADSLHVMALNEAENIAVARKALEDAHFNAKEAYNKEDALRKKGFITQANESLKELKTQMGIAAQKSIDMVAYASRIKHYADLAERHFQDVRGAKQRAEESKNFAYLSIEPIRKAATRAAQFRADATRIADLAGRVLAKEAEIQKSWDEAEELASFEAAERARVTAIAGSDESGIRRAQESTKAAETLASNEWRKADLRIAEGEANARRSRSESVTGPSSPFYFASTAHFPLRDFGLRGEPLDRDGILIYEDMAFHFDREGNYEVHFRATAPNMPATMRLQFQIQPHRNGPWYTVTLAPIEFPYPTTLSGKVNCSGSSCSESECNDESNDCCGKARECICKGRSEILRRCYAEMGQDAKIRRSGTARIGFGVNGP